MAAIGPPAGRNAPGSKRHRIMGLWRYAEAGPPRRIGQDEHYCFVVT